MTEERRKKREKKRPEEPAKGDAPHTASEPQLAAPDSEGTRIDADRKRSFFAFSGQLDALERLPPGTETDLTGFTHVADKLDSDPEPPTARAPAPAPPAPPASPVEEADDETASELIVTDDFRIGEADVPTQTREPAAADEVPTTTRPEPGPESFAGDEADTDTKEELAAAPGDLVLRYEGDDASVSDDATRTEAFADLAAGAVNAPSPEADEAETHAPAPAPASPLPADRTQTDVFRPAPAFDDDAPTDTHDPAARPAPCAQADETVTHVPGRRPAAAPPAPTVEPETFTEAPIFTEAEPQPEPEDDTRGRIVSAVPRHRRLRGKRPGIVRRAAAALAARIDLRGARAAAGRAWTELRARWKAGGQRSRAEVVTKAERTTEWWRRTLTELAVLYGIVVPIELAVNGGHVGAFGIHPHPYWLIILPMAGARGMVAAMLAAGIGSVLFALGAMQALGSADPSVVFTFSTMLEPILFFGVGFFVGELHDELALRLRKIERELSEVRERNRRLRQERDVLADANRELERRIVDDSAQFGNLIVAATRIEQSGRSEVFEIALDLVEEHCGAAASVLMLLDDGSIDFLCHRGWPDEEIGRRLQDARESAFVRRAIESGKHVNGFDEDESPPEKGPLVVAPLFYSGGVVKALLCLDEIPPERLNESTVTLFFGITEWVSAALARLVRGAELPATPKTIAPVAQAEAYLGTADDLGVRLRLELERCTRYGVPTSFLAIQAPEWKDSSPDGQRTVDRYALTHFTGGLRPSDELFRFGYPGCYLLVLAGTTVEGAEVVRSRLLRRVEYSPSREVGAIEVFATGPDAEAPDLLSLVERVAQRFRRGASLPLDARCPVHVPERTDPGGIEEFLRRLRMETSLAVRNGFDLHVIGISCGGGASADLNRLARHVHEAGDRTLRPTDGVYGIGPNHCAVVLPITDAEQAATVAHRLVTAVRERDPDAPYGDLETQVLSLGTSHPDASSFLAALAKGRAEA